MKVCVYGAGAIGGHVAVRLMNAGAAEVSVVARGTQLQAIRKDGLTLKRNGRSITAKPAAATDDPATLPAQDLVIVTLKAYAVSAEAQRLRRLLAPEAAVLFILNGIPWWWNHGLSTGGALPLLDPNGALWNTLGPERALGCVVYSSNTVTAPGVVTHEGGNQWLIGEPDRSDSARLGATVALFKKAGLNAEPSADLRREIWHKLVLNAAFNPLAALTRLDTGSVGGDGALASLARRIVDETLAVAAAQGCDISGQVGAEGIMLSGSGGWRPSMLQDVDRGRPVEAEAILGQTQAFARQSRVATPTIDVILPLLRGLDRALRGGE